MSSATSATQGLVRVERIKRVPLTIIPQDSCDGSLDKANGGGEHLQVMVEREGVNEFALAQVVRVPLVVIPPDPLGAAVRSPLKLGWQDGWGRLRAEREMRRYPWGVYSRVKAEVCIAHLC